MKYLNFKVIYFIIPILFTFNILIGFFYQEYFAYGRSIIFPNIFVFVIFYIFLGIVLFRLNNLYLNSIKVLVTFLMVLFSTSYVNIDSISYRMSYGSAFIEIWSQEINESTLNCLLGKVELKNQKYSKTKITLLSNLRKYTLFTISYEFSRCFDYSEKL